MQAEVTALRFVRVGLSALVVALLALAGCAAGKGAEPAEDPVCPCAGEGNSPGHSQAEPPRGDELERAAGHSQALVPVMDADPQWGSRTAPVTIVEFSDFECPFCARVNATLEQIKGIYGAEQVRIVWKHNPLPFHRAARPTHEAATTVHALGGDFWTFHELAFSNQKALTNDNFIDWAVRSGVDTNKFEAALRSRENVHKVDEDIALARRVGATGTPAFRINGVTVSGAQPLSAFKEVIDAQLQQAAELRAGGKAAEEVYPLLVARNLILPDAETHVKYEEPAPDLSVWHVPVYADDPVSGPKDALVTIVQFSEFQCPFCKRVRSTLQQVRDAYGNQVRIVWKDNPLAFHPRARPAANLARAVYAAKGNAGFWAAHDALFESQPALEEADFKALAVNLGVRWSVLQQAMTTDRYATKFQQSQWLAEDLQARGTPHFFINGLRVAGAQPFEKFKEVIDQQLAAAQALVAGGTPRAKVYEHIMKGARQPDPPVRKQVTAPNGPRPSKGNPKAPVEITIFSDFQCPFCARANPTLQEVLAKYGKDVKIVWRNLPLPFHKEALLAAEAAQEVFTQQGDAAFWRYHDKLFEAQKQPEGLRRPHLEKLAAELGVDMMRFRAALDAETHRALIAADVEAANQAGISSTPNFLVNGYVVSGAQPYVAFDRMIRYALAHP